MSGLERFSRRGVLLTSAGIVASPFAPSDVMARQAANPAGLRALTSIDGVHTPPKGGGVQKFSFANPEPSVGFAGLLFGFEVVTFENNYGIDTERAKIEQRPDGLTLTVQGFTWAGGQRRHAGSLVATLTRKIAGAVEWDVTAQTDRPIKAIKTIVRGLPKGRLSMAFNDWRDAGDNETIFEYPALMGGMATPSVLIEDKDGKVWGLSALQTEVRPARFAFMPGADGFKVELVYEQAGWDRRNSVKTCSWRIAPDASAAAAGERHFADVERNWSIPDLQSRTDAPDWMKHLSCVLTLHGQHWTGYVFNDFDRQLEILRWAAERIDPTHVMVFLTGWDGRYYWDYPTFEPGEATGGQAALRNLIAEGRKLGFRFALMFGTNIANPAHSQYAAIADARLRDNYGDPFPGNYVDWDGDRKGDGSMVFMNLAVQSWRDHLTRRISAMIQDYDIDAYFLDICGLWENNPAGDMLVATRMLVEDLASLHPGVPAIAEMQYDAQMAFIPMNHVPRYPLYSQANFAKVASYGHLSWPAPGRGSTGVHESGFGRYQPVNLYQPQLPTISFVDDTFVQNRDAVVKDLETIRQRFEVRGGRT